MLGVVTDDLCDGPVLLRHGLDVQVKPAGGMIDRMHQFHRVLGKHHERCFVRSEWLECNGNAQRPGDCTDLSNGIGGAIERELMRVAFHHIALLRTAPDHDPAAHCRAQPSQVLCVLDAALSNSIIGRGDVQASRLGEQPVHTGQL